MRTYLIRFLKIVIITFAVLVSGSDSVIRLDMRRFNKVLSFLKKQKLITVFVLKVITLPNREPVPLGNTWKDGWNHSAHSDTSRVVKVEPLPRQLDGWSPDRISSIYHTPKIKNLRRALNRN